MAIDRKRVTLDGTTPSESYLWWTQDDESIGPAMVAVAQKYEAAMSDRREQSRRYVQLHKGQILTHSMLDTALPRTAGEDQTLSWNVVQAAENTAKSAVIRNRVRVVLQTNGADYEQQESAKRAELFIHGVFAGNKVYEELDSTWFYDAATPGLGMLLTEPDEMGNVTINRIIPDALIFNEVEAIRGKPRQIFYVEWLSKWDAVSKYATTFVKDEKTGKLKAKVDTEKRDAINAVTAYELPMPSVAGNHIPLIPVYHGWFLPSRLGVGDGRRVSAIVGCTLSAREWKWTRFPMSPFRVENAPAGLWGIGIAERLAGFQMRLNELNFLIEEAARLGSVGKWMVDTGSNVNPAQLNNEQEGIVYFTGAVPVHVTNDGIPRDLLAERDATYQQALREIGLSEWTVGGTQPDNIESGEGLRELRDQEQGRAVPAGQNWEAAHVDLAECAIMAACDAFDTFPDLQIQVADPDGDGLTKVQFKEIAALLQDPDAYQIRPYPTSILPQSPTGKFEKLRQWKADGTIDHATFVALSDMPDTFTESSLMLAGIKAVRHAVGQIVKRGAAGYEPPDPAMPLDFAIKLGHSTYLKGLRSGMPETKLALLLNWIDDARALTKPPEQLDAPGAAMAGAAGAAGGAPDMEPEPAPGALPVGDPALMSPVAPEMMAMQQEQQGLPPEAMAPPEDMPPL